MNKQHRSDLLLERALAVQRETISLFPDDIVSRNGFAGTLRQLGRLEEAASAYEETVSMFPDDIAARIGLAETTKVLSRLDDALRLYEETIARFPDNMVARSGRAEVLRMEGRYEDALADLESTLELSPNEVIVRTQFADTLAHLGREGEAIKIYEEIIQQFPSNPVARNGLAEVLRSAAENDGVKPNGIGYRYQIALSFAGEDRATASEIADRLIKRGISVFYDKYERAELWGKDLYQHLASVYAEQAQFCVILVSTSYATKLWTKHGLWGRP